MIWLALIAGCVAGAAASAYWMVRRGRARTALLELSLERLESSLQCARAGTFRFDSQRNTVELGGACAELLGLPPETRETSLDYWRACVHPEDLPAALAALDAYRSSSRAGPDATHLVSYRVRSGTGWRWCTSYSQQVPGGDQGVLFDSSGFKELEREQRAYEERLRAASAAAKFFTWEIDVKARVQHIDMLDPDEQVRAHPGFKVHGLGGTITLPMDDPTIRAWAHPDDFEGYRECIQRQLQGVGPFSHEARALQPSGEYHWTALHWTVVRDAGGEPVRLLGVTQDIDDRKRAELELRTAEARFARAIRGTNDGLWELNLRTRELWWAPRMYEMVGWQGESNVDEQAARSFLDSNTLARMSEFTRQHLEQGKPVDLELPMRTASGTRWFHLRGAMERDNEQRPHWLSGCMQDITASKVQEQALIDATHAAAAANRAKSAFLANMSHEIRTPMNGVIGMTNLLLDTPLNTVQRDYAEAIRSSGEALLMIINDILDFSKIEAGELRLEQLDMDLRDTCEEAARLLAIQAHAKGIELTLRIDPRLPSLVRADAGRIRQVLLNLGGNAVKFTQRGEVAITLDVLELKADATVIRCAVRDTGIGIPPDRLSGLFRPFTQVDASTTRKFGGTGLGLSIVHRLVQLMGGETGASSAPGAGSTFWFTARLGCVPAQVLAPQSAAAGVPPCRVLVVADNAAQRGVLVSELQECGVTASAAHSATTALACLEEALDAGQPFDVALIDRVLPDAEGAQLAASIRARPTLHALRMVLLMSAGERSDRRLVVQMGFATYLMKPVFRRDLEACLRQVLAEDGQRHLENTQPVARRVDLAESATTCIRRILLAEDNLINQKVAQRLLERMGYLVDIVSDGRAAVAAWQAGRYDAILMDCQMPEMDGYEATREIRRLENGAHRIPIIALTAHAMKGADAECLAAGMDDYLTKPIDVAALRVCMERYLTVEPGAQSVA